MAKKNKKASIVIINKLPDEILIKSDIKIPRHWGNSIFTMMLAALVAVIMSCYPIIFCGKSFVSPASVSALVYSWWPPMPGMGNEKQFNQHGSDTGATMWAMAPWAKAESESILDHGELPLWNRYSHAGETLIGQGISQLGDPLHWMVILARGEAFAWDMKYILAKFLFCVGFGLLVNRLIASRGLAILYSVLAAWSGAFFYTFSHPSFFVFSYTPWMLLSAINMLLSTPRKAALWGCLWLLANVACFNAGMLSVAVILIGALNLAALAYAFGYSKKRKESILRLAVGVTLFFGWTAPFWISFIVTEKDAFSLHTEVKVDQLPLHSAAGAFDDIFYRIASDGNGVSPAPGASMLIFVGFFLALLNWKKIRNDFFYWVNTAAIVLWGGFVFGWVPASIVELIPFLNRVGHIATDFSYLLVFHLTLHSAYGFYAISKNTAVRWNIIQFSFMIVVMLAGMFFITRGQSVNHAPRIYLFVAAACAVAAPLVFAILKSLNREKSHAGWIAIILLGFVPCLRHGLYTFGDETLLMKPGKRESLDFPSESIRRIKQSEHEPFRVTGLQSSLIGNYSAMYQLEDIRTCSPLINKPLVDLVRGFPGVDIVAWGWVVGYTNPVLANPLFNLLNVKYLLAHPQTQIQGDIGFDEYDRSDFLVIKNSEAWPRAFYTNCIFETVSLDDFKNCLIANPNVPFAAFSDRDLAKEPKIKQSANVQSPSVVAASDYTLGPNSTKFSVKAPSAGAIALMEANAGDFHATINGEKAQVYTVNHAFKAVYVDGPGQYTVEFRYLPSHWKIAQFLFCVAALTTLGIALFVFYKIRPVESPLADQSS